MSQKQQANYGITFFVIIISYNSKKVKCFLVESGNK